MGKLEGHRSKKPLKRIGTTPPKNAEEKTDIIVATLNVQTLRTEERETELENALKTI